MLSTQPNYHLSNKDTATVEFVSNMLQNEANNYLSNMSHLSHVSKMCSTLSWANPAAVGSQTSSGPVVAPTAAAAAAAAALAASHNIESFLGGSFSVKIDNDSSTISNKPNINNNISNSNYNKQNSNLNVIDRSNGFFSPLTHNNKKNNNNSEFNNSYDAGNI
jgi:hypothetical protein